MCACCVGLLCTARAAGCATSARWRTSVWPAWCTAPGDAPQAQPCSTRVRAVHLHSVIYTRMVVDGGRRRRRRGTDKQGGCGAAGAQLAWTCPSRAGPGAHAAQGPRTYLRFYNIYIYIHMYVPACQHHDRACVQAVGDSWPGRGPVAAQCVRSMLYTAAGAPHAP